MLLRSVVALRQVLVDDKYRLDEIGTTTNEHAEKYFVV